jgi:UPF0716 protein FxsA
VWFLGMLVFVAAEVVAFVAVGSHIGFGWALLILIGVSALGPFVVRRVGLGVLGRAQGRLNQGDVPTRELLDGVVVLLGGLMICVPGFISDAIGLLLMIGPVRDLLIRVSGRRLAGRVRTMGQVRWTVIDAGSWSSTDAAPAAATPSERMIESGEPPSGPRRNSMGGGRPNES